MFAHIFSSPHSPMRDEWSISTENPHFSAESDSNPEFNYTKYINLDVYEDDKRNKNSSQDQEVNNQPESPVKPNGNFFKPIFSNLQQFVSSQLSQNDYLKLIEKSKRIIKRENAKKRVKMSKIQQNSSEENEERNSFFAKFPSINTKSIEKNNKKNPEQIGEKGTSDKDIKKVIQKLRNRISAQQSRDRKKQYLENLEKENQLLQEEIKALKQIKQENEVQKEEKKLNALGILKLGMTFLSMFMIIVGKSPVDNNNPLSNTNNASKENKGLQYEGLNLVSNAAGNFWGKIEFEDLKQLNEKEIYTEIMNKIKMYKNFLKLIIYYLIEKKRNLIQAY